MAQITWTDEAARWLEDIFEHIAEQNPDAAGRTVEGIFERAHRTVNRRGHLVVATDGVLAGAQRQLWTADQRKR